MKSVIINFFILYLFSINAYAGVSVLGTRFFFYEKSKKINITIINDDESDYLIKTEIKNNKNFVISPPLFIINKNQSNIVSIIPEDVDYDYDKVFDLIVTAIPKSNLSYGNSIKLAIRSNFKLIYRFQELNDSILKSIILKSYSEIEDLLINPTKHFITIDLICNDNKFRFNINPNQEALVPHCINPQISLVRDDGSISSTKNINLE